MASLHCRDGKECGYSHHTYVVSFARLCQRVAESLQSLPTSTSTFTPVLAPLPPSSSSIATGQRWVISFPLPRIRPLLERLLGDRGRLAHLLAEWTGVRYHTLPDIHRFPDFTAGQQSLDWHCLNAEGSRDAVDAWMHCVLHCLDGDWRKESAGPHTEAEEMRAALRAFDSLGANRRAPLLWHEFLTLIARKAPLLPPLPPSASHPPAGASAGTSPSPSKVGPATSLATADEALLKSAPLDLYEWYEEGLRQPFSSAIHVADFTSTPVRYIRALTEETFACLPIEAREDVRTLFSIEPLPEAQVISAISRQFGCEVFVPPLKDREEKRQGSGAGEGSWLQVTVWRSHPRGPAPLEKDRRSIEDAVRALLQRYHSVKRRCGLSGANRPTPTS